MAMALANRGAWPSDVPAGSRFRAAGLSDVGRLREVNEDRLHIDVTRGIFLVVDGVGGQAAGGKAADIAVQMLRERLERQTGALVDRVREAITIANNEIFHAALRRPEWKGMACVLTVAVVEADRLVIGHVGDTRLYLVTDGQPRKLTPDHSPVGEREDARELSELEAMRHPRRNEVFRDVGSTVHHLGDSNFIHIAETRLPPDAALLLCSDGLTDLVPIDAIRQAIRVHRGRPGDVVPALVQAANDAGGKDNVTVVYVETGPSGAGPASVASATVGSHPRKVWPWLLLLLVLLGSVAGGWWLWRDDWWRTTSSMAGVMAPPAAGATIVRPSESIGDAIERAQPGSSVVVEPGEYRERLTLKDHVRVISRVPRGATLRLPAGASSDDAVVVAAGTIGAELSGFRIVGDAGAPLGIGVITRDASVRFIDLDIAGASTAAFDLGAGDDLMVAGSDVHDNAGAVLILGPAASPRLSHNHFSRSMTSTPSAEPFVFDPTAQPSFVRNVFRGFTATSVPVVEAHARQSLVDNNWFITPPSSARGTAPAPRSR